MEQDARAAQEGSGDRAAAGDDPGVDFTRGSVLRHILRLAVFTGIYQLLEVVYYLADLYWIGSLGEEATAAVTMAGNLQLISVGLGLTIMVGATPIVAQAAGARDKAELRALFDQILILAASVAALFTAAAYLVLPFYFGWLGANAPTAALGHSYTVWLIPGLALKLAAMAMISPLRAFGDMKTAVTANGTALLLNVALDPLFILGVGPMPAMGVTGAGIASFIAGCVALAIMTWRYELERRRLPFQPRAWRPRLEMWGRTLRIGLPVGSNAVVDMTWAFIVYWAIRDFGTAGQAAVGIAEKIRTGTLLPVYAVAFSIAPIVGQNLGGRRLDRVRRAFTSTSLVSGGLMLALTLVIQLGPHWFVGPFSNDPESLALAAGFLGIIAWCQPPSAILNNCLGVFEGLGNTIPPILTDFLRLAVFALPVFLFARNPGFEFLHLAYIIVFAYVVQLVVLPYLLRREMRRHQRHLAGPLAPAAASGSGKYSAAAG